MKESNIQKKRAWKFSKSHVKALLIQIKSAQLMLELKDKACLFHKDPRFANDTSENMAMNTPASAVSHFQRQLAGNK